MAVASLLGNQLGSQVAVPLAANMVSTKFNSSVSMPSVILVQFWAGTWSILGWNLVYFGLELGLF